MAKRVAVVLSGCGVMDGSEVHEAVLTLAALDRAGAQAICCAPDVPQADVVNHLANAPQGGEGRRVLVESARIARGKVVPLSAVSADQLDAAILPGGFGAAKNLSSFAADGAECRVNAELADLLAALHKAGKPIGVMCIAPAVAARVFGQAGVVLTLTIGTDRDTAAALEAMGARHVDCAVDDVVIDQANRVVSTPAYMLADGPAQAAKGIDRLVAEVLRLARG